MEDERYLIEGEFAFKSYRPLKLRKGMHFLYKLKSGLLEPEWLFFTLTEIPEDEEMYMSLYGAPVHVYIVEPLTNDAMAEPKHIGWFNDGTEDAELHLITDEEITLILNEDDGFIDIECYENGDIIFDENRVIISRLEEDEEDE